MTFLTPSLRALVGVSTGWEEAPHAVEASEVRRFCHATLDADWARRSAAGRGGELTAPPAFVTEMFRRPASASDPLDRFGEDRDFDGAAQQFRGLPEIRTPLRRLLNGGYSYRFLGHACVGDRIERRSLYADIAEKQGREGPMLVIQISTDYRIVRGNPLLSSVATLIQR